MGVHKRSAWAKAASGESGTRASLWRLAIVQEGLHQCGQALHFRAEHAEIPLILLPGGKTRLKGVEC